MVRDREITVGDRIADRLCDISLGLVLTPLGLHEVVDAVARENSLEISYLRAFDGRSPVQVHEDSSLYRVEVSFLLQTQLFHSFRDVEVIPGSRGVFNFTASYSWSREVEGNYNSWHTESGRVDFRFHVANNKQATFTVL